MGSWPLDRRFRVSSRRGGGPMRERYGDRPHAGSSRAPRHRGSGRTAAPPRRRRALRRVLLLVLSALLLTPPGVCLWADIRLNREVDLGGISDRPPRGTGTNYLIVGSDSREGLSSRARRELHTGTAEGRRTDSMILLHTGAHGTTMVSLPRDSWVVLPPYTEPETGKRHGPAPDKLNAAFSIGGPELLVRTVERNTGLRIDHYAEIGFRGFVDLVDDVGGVRLCLDRDIRDEKSGANLRKGCHNRHGAQALAFVRQRHQERQGDLGRTRNQQRFLAALADKVSQRDVLLDPSRIYPATRDALETLVVDEDMELWDLVRLLRAMKSVSAPGSGARVNVPVAAVGVRTTKGSAISWDREKARDLFTALRNDRPPGRR
ncbi:LCP family protein [Streptomyces koelreuteriae]|uniref:LCP family protein n=2 Tax=Streptomyces TaxID=1883 RepID=A0ABX8G222_9ACTN|nr:LCP family protein [Streptomyces koelreuteriae]